jgi:hypothetical protein
MKKLALLIIMGWMPLLILSQGCVDVSGDDGVQVIGFIQPQWQYSFDGDNSNSFLFNRARLGVAGNIPYDFRYYAVLEMSPFFTGQPFLLDAFISYNRLMWVQGALGQFKSPFSLELQTPCHMLHTVYRAHFLVDLASPLRDIGFMVYGGNDTTIVRYQFAIMNGTGMNKLDDNAAKDYVGRFLIQPLKGMLSFGGSFRYGLSPSTVAEQPQDEHNRYAGEIRFHWRNFNIQGEYIWGQDIGSYTTGGGCGGPGEIVQGTIKRQGWYVMAYYMTPVRLEPVLKFESYNKDIDKTKDPNEPNMLAYVGTVGISYFFNDWTRLQINYLYRVEKDNEIDNDQFVVQLQAVF